MPQEIRASGTSQTQAGGHNRTYETTTAGLLGVDAGGAQGSLDAPLGVGTVSTALRLLQ